MGPLWTTLHFHFAKHQVSTTDPFHFLLLPLWIRLENDGGSCRVFYRGPLSIETVNGGWVDSCDFDTQFLTVDSPIED